MSFPNQKIYLRLSILESVRQSNFLTNTLIGGYVITKNGKWYFSSKNFFQTEFSYESETYLLNDFAICKEKFSLDCLNSLSVNLIYDNLIRLDKFIDLDKKDKELFINENFDRIVFNSSDNETTVLINEYDWSFRNYNREYFSLRKNPRVELTKSMLLDFDYLQNYISNFSYFLQLIFGIQQSVTDVHIKAINPLLDKTTINVYYYHSKLIENKLNDQTRSHMHPVFSLKDLVNEIEILYLAWLELIFSKNTLTRLFFNEVNSVNYILDDRFKNLCSIIQGLKDFAFSVPKNKSAKGEKVRNQMFQILNFSFDDAFMNLIRDVVNVDFVNKLLRIIAEMRDFFQHLNKKISHDLSNHSESMHTINLLLEINIRYHFLKMIKLEKEKIFTLIRKDLRFVDLGLYKLRNKLIIDGVFFLRKSIKVS